MTFDPTIPTDLPPPKIAVDELRLNFSEYATVFDNNHIALNATYQGKHSDVILQRQLLDPIISGDFDSLYSKSVVTTSNTSDELFVRIPQFLPPEFPNIPMQLTFNSINTSAPEFQSFMIGGYIVYFGKITTVPFLVTLVPTPSEILCIIANGNSFTSIGTPIPIDVAVLKSGVNNFQFTITSAAFTAGDSISWFAIAKQ